MLTLLTRYIILTNDSLTKDAQKRVHLRLLRFYPKATDPDKPRHKRSSYHVELILDHPIFLDDEVAEMRNYNLVC